MSHGDTVLHLQQPSSLQSKVKRSWGLLEQSKGTAVMWDLRKLNVIQSILEMEFHVTSDRRRLGRNVFFFSKRIRVERNLSREDDFGSNNSSHEETDREPNKSKPEIHSLEPGEFPSLQTLTIYTRKYTTKHKDTRWIIFSECFPEYESLLKRWTGVTLKIYLKKKKTEYLGDVDCGVHRDLVRPILSIYSLEPFQN